MKIFAIMLVKDEVDIVSHVLKAAEVWADKIFILDNGSTDGTWELIQSMKNDVITPWKQYFGDYHNGLRADVFNEFKHLSEPGDWWCYKLDADEFYVDDPREFLPKIPKRYHWVGKRSIDYVITREDVKEYTFTNNFEEDKKHLKYILPTCESEGRFFRYRKGLTWENTYNSHYPPHIGVQAYDYIIVKHYRDRSPELMKKRLTIRFNSQAHKNGVSWTGDLDMLESDKKLFLSRKDCILDPNDINEYKKLKLRFGNFKQNIVKNFVKRLLIWLRVYN